LNRSSKRLGLKSSGRPGEESHSFVAIGTSRIHGEGMFARESIRAGARLIQYRGERISKAESLRRCEAGNQFIFGLSDTEDLDGSSPENFARYINHSCAPNTEARFERGEIWVVAIRDIGAGEEIAFNYSYDLDDYREHPCCCGAPNCAGYMVAEEFFEHVRGR
jgi:SET domain-containing protein